MLQTLLAERFKLAVHRETKMLPVYELVTAKSGSKLRQAETREGSSISSGGGKMTVRHVSMPGFATALSRHIGRPVFDKTGIDGAFDFTLEYAPDGADSAGRPSIFTALQEQLGLRLEAAKGPVEILVIDRANKVPTDN
jgi:uncharacterized protein (TIGR03435 family)